MGPDGAGPGGPKAARMKGMNPMGDDFFEALGEMPAAMDVVADEAWRALLRGKVAGLPDEDPAQAALMDVIRHVAAKKAALN